MPRKTQFNVRLSDEAIKALGELAERSGLKVAEVMRRLVPDPAWLSICAAEAALAGDTGVSPVEALVHVAADGLRARMIERGVDPYFVESLDANATAETYLHFLDAVANAAGVRTWDDRAPDWHFEAPPAGGDWERMHVRGLAILRRSEHLTANGVERRVSDAS
jgi:hypothetical protein